MSGDNDNTFESLLKELRTNRKSLDDMVIDATVFRKKLDVLLPSGSDYKNRFVMMERMKTLSQVITSELQIRSQIDSSIKLEADLKKKADDGEYGSETFEEKVRLIATAMELNENKNDLKFKTNFDSNEENKDK